MDGHTLADYNVQKEAVLILKINYRRFYDVSVNPGEGIGEAFIAPSETILSAQDRANGNYDRSAGCFFYDREDAVCYALPSVCPFTAPEGLEFDGWYARHCASIGAEAFRDCAGLTQIRLPQDCQIDGTAFAGCGTVYVFAPANGSAETSCSAIANCVFVAE